MRQRQLAGFTLIELVMTIVLMGIIMVVIGRVLIEGYEQFTTANNFQEVDSKALLVLERIVNDIHTLRSVNDLTTIGASQITFINSSGATIQYQLSGSSLLRNSQTLATGVQSINFIYDDANGNVTATPSAVRFIEITLTVSQGSFSAGFSTQASVRGAV